MARERTPEYDSSGLPLNDGPYDGLAPSPEEILAGILEEVNTANQGRPALRFEVVGMEVLDAAREAALADREKDLPHQMNVGENIEPEYK